MKMKYVENSYRYSYAKGAAEAHNKYTRGKPCQSVLP